jgi:fucose permease
VIPQLFVYLKQMYDFQLVFLLLMVPCYLYILYFALHGHRIGHKAVPPAPAARDALSQS